MTQLAHIESGQLMSEPASIETVLMLAIERGTDPANLERLLALQERIMAQRAEQAYTAAMLGFREAVPKIIKRNPVYGKDKLASDGKTTIPGALMYKFADLENVQDVVDPLLHQRGFCYSFDSAPVGDQLVVTCIMRHRDGHTERCRFASPRSPIPNASPAQISGGTMSYGERFSLLGVLGLRAAKDNDARPMPAPIADASAPVVPTREERRAAPAPAATIDGQLVVELKAEWDAWIGEQCPKEQFFKWAKRLLETPLGMDKVQHWTAAAIATCREAMKVRPE